MLAKRECTADDREQDEALNGVVHVTTPRLQRAQAERRPGRCQQREATRRGSRREERSNRAKFVQR